jgi:hypothetical protein
LPPALVSALHVIEYRSRWPGSLPASTLPNERCKLGYTLVEIGETERILPTAITERLCLGADGALEDRRQHARGRADCDACGDRQGAAV